MSKSMGMQPACTAAYKCVRTAESLCGCAQKVDCSHQVGDVSAILIMNSALEEHGDRSRTPLA